MAQNEPSEVRAMKESLQVKTGKPFDEWVEIARASKLAKHGEVLKFLKDNHGLGHGYANLVAHTLFASAAVLSDDRDAFIEQQYAGAKAALRPIYDKVLSIVLAFGDDVEIAPMKAYVSLRRKKQFLCIQPSTKDRVDVGIKLKGAAPTERLLEGGFNGMVSHHVRVNTLDDIDEQLLAWIRQAYDGAG